MKPWGTLVALSLAACASGGTGGSTSAPQTVRIGGASGTSVLSMSGSDASHTHTIAFPPDQVFRLIPNVLDSLGIPVTLLEPAKRTIGNPGLKIRGRLKSTPLSRFIDCGSSTQVGANADNYDVSLSMIIDVKPSAGNASTVTTTFEAVAKPVNFSQEYSQCSSRGLLESRFMEQLTARLQR